MSAQTLQTQSTGLRVSDFRPTQKIDFWVACAFSFSLLLADEHCGGPEYTRRRGASKPRLACGPPSLGADHECLAVTGPERHASARRANELSGPLRRCLCPRTTITSCNTCCLGSVTAGSRRHSKSTSCCNPTTTGASSAAVCAPPLAHSLPAQKLPPAEHSNFLRRFEPARLRSR